MGNGMKMLEEGTKELTKEATAGFIDFLTEQLKQWKNEILELPVKNKTPRGRKKKSVAEGREVREGLGAKNILERDPDASPEMEVA